MAGPVGIRDVAERARISVGTVSNVLNKPEIVAKATRQRVLAVIDELGFVRNDLARQLKMGGGTTLGMIVLSVANPFFADLAHACEAAAEQSGYTVVLGSSDGMRGREDHYMDLFEEQRVRGMMVAPFDGATDRMRQMRNRGMHMVLFDSLADESDFCTVALDGAAGGALAARHLIETGRRRIAFVAGASHLLEDRWTGAQRACAEHQNVRLERLDSAGQTVAAGHAAGTRLAALPASERPDAVFAGNDQLAIGLMHALVLADDVDVPRDIAIMGYDDIDYAASAIIPLTTIRQPTHAIAREAIRLIVDESANLDHAHESVRLVPELVVRESTPALG